MIEGFIDWCDYEVWKKINSAATPPKGQLRPWGERFYWMEDNTWFEEEEAQQGQDLWGFLEKRSSARNPEQR